MRLPDRNQQYGEALESQQIFPQSLLYPLHIPACRELYRTAFWRDYDLVPGMLASSSDERGYYLPAYQHNCVLGYGTKHNRLY